MSANSLQKIRYTHEDMVDCLLANPAMSQNALAARYGFTPAWVSTVMSSDAWKAAYAARRGAMVDPVLGLTMHERINALAEKSLAVLMEKLSAPKVSDTVALRAFELGAKASGSGALPSVPPSSDHLPRLASRLIELQSNVRQGVTINGSSQVVEAGS
tara:strand:- start:5910 stop:6383 length:474 start_codon:yes stop_codon:yes gene_type:complete